MNISRRDLGSQATLVFYEFSLVPLSILATFFVLSFAGGLVALTRIVATRIGIGSTLVDGLTALIIALTGAAMVAAGGTVVYGYQHFFDRSVTNLRPLALLAAPLIGLIGSTVYALATLRTLTPPWWVSLIVVLCAYALAFRTVAVYSMLAGRRRSGTNAGTVVAIPAILALITLVTGHILDAEWNETGQLVTGLVAWSPPSLDLAGLVAFPVLFAAAYGSSCTPGEGISRRIPASPRPPSSISTVLDRLDSLSVADRLGSRSRADGGPDGGTARRVRSSGAPPPSSPDSGGSNGRGSGGATTGTSGPARSVFRGGRGAPSNESDDRSGSDRDARGARSNDAIDETDATADESSEGADETEMAAVEAGEGSSPREGTADAARSASADAAGGEPDSDTSGTGSDTRIFTDDFGQYDGAEGSIETCPDCAAEIPSDGQYKYCPQCGSEL